MPRLLQDLFLTRRLLAGFAPNLHSHSSMSTSAPSAKDSTSCRAHPTATIGVPRRSLRSRAVRATSTMSPSAENRPATVPMPRKGISANTSSLSSLASFAPSPTTSTSLPCSRKSSGTFFATRRSPRTSRLPRPTGTGSGSRSRASVPSATRICRRARARARAQVRPARRWSGARRPVDKISIASASTCGRVRSGGAAKM